MADLQVTWVDLLAASALLGRATAEADALPASVGAAFDQLDMAGSSLAWATAELLEAWFEGLTALVRAGEGLQQWLAAAAGAYREADERLAGR